VFVAVVHGALLGNMWEELGWTSFLQSRLMDRHGVFTGSVAGSTSWGWSSWRRPSP
jgi:hypothetical protein